MMYIGMYKLSFRVYKAVGHAMEDIVMANLIYQRAKQQGVGCLTTL
jgi:ornithine cyclodeaminase/alanine dehydrogenase-like protein (mu-crystallin family)